MSLQTSARIEWWEYETPFVIARGKIIGADLLVVELRDGAATGCGEACPTPHYGETAEGALEIALKALERLKSGTPWSVLHDQMRPGAGRNAIDCAVWDLRAKQESVPVTTLLGLSPMKPVVTAFTLSIDTPEAMAKAARAAAPRYSLIKVKLGAGDQDFDRIRAIRDAAPNARLIVDVNEGWDLTTLEKALPILAACKVEMVEQPLPAGRDSDLSRIDHVVPIGADESCHVSGDLDQLVGLYDVVNIKLDKTGGLTEAMRLLKRASTLGFDAMIGCMTATSLGIAPGVIVAQQCRFVDLDSPLMLARDRAEHLVYEGDHLMPPSSTMWG